MTGDGMGEEEVAGEVSGWGRRKSCGRWQAAGEGGWQSQVAGWGEEDTGVAGGRLVEKEASASGGRLGKKKASAAGGD
jgi:hypothetical protein